MTETREIRIPTDDVILSGILATPEPAQAIVVFVHGAGSSRLSPRNTYVADVLNDAGLATLLFDLLTEDEDRDYANRFDIDLLTLRLASVVSWLQRQPATQDLPLGLFGASTGAAAALRVAASEPAVERLAVVSRGGRVDLAGDALPRVTSPALFIVGSADTEVLELNRRALEQVASPDKTLTTVPGATHLFEEPGALEQVAGIARDWLVERLVTAGART